MRQATCFDRRSWSARGSCPARWCAAGKFDVGFRGESRLDGQTDVGSSGNGRIKFTGIGLANIGQRLRTLYGAQAKMRTSNHHRFMGAIRLEGRRLISETRVHSFLKFFLRTSGERLLKGGGKLLCIEIVPFFLISRNSFLPLLHDGQFGRP